MASGEGISRNLENYTLTRLLRSLLSMKVPRMTLFFLIQMSYTFWPVSWIGKSSSSRVIVLRGDGRGVAAETPHRDKGGGGFLQLLRV